MAKMANTLKELNRSAEEDYKKARISFQMGRFEEALDAYGKAVDAWKKMADLFFETRKEASGREFLEKAQEARSCYGMSLFKLERYEEALEIVDAALEVKPDSPTEWSNRGFVLSALDRNKEALEAFEKALSFDPGISKNPYQQGYSLFQDGTARKSSGSF